LSTSTVRAPTCAVFADLAGCFGQRGRILLDDRAAHEDAQSLDVFDEIARCAEFRFVDFGDLMSRRGNAMGLQSSPAST
jgi:hypothetical protein